MQDMLLKWVFDYLVISLSLKNNLMQIQVDGMQGFIQKQWFWTLDLLFDFVHIYLAPTMCWEFSHACTTDTSVG